MAENQAQPYDFADYYRVVVWLLKATSKKVETGGRCETEPRYNAVLGSLRSVDTPVFGVNRGRLKLKRCVELAFVE